MAKIRESFNGRCGSNARAGLMISIGKSLPLIDPNLGLLVTTGGVLESIGWAIIGNLHLLFALAIGGSWAKDRAGGAFARGFLLF